MKQISGQTIYFKIYLYPTVKFLG